MNELIAQLPDALKNELIRRLVGILSTVSHGRPLPSPASPEQVLIAALSAIPGVNIIPIEKGEDPEQVVAAAIAAAEALEKAAKPH